MNIRAVNGTSYNVPIRGLGIVRAGRSRSFIGVTTAMLESGGVAADLERLRSLSRLSYTILRDDEIPNSMERPTVEDLAGGRIIYRSVSITNDDCTADGLEQSFSMGSDLPAGSVPFYVSIRLVAAALADDADSITARISCGSDTTASLNVDAADGANDGESLVAQIPHQSASAQVNLVIETSGQANVSDITEGAISATMMVFVPTVE